jgi:4-hydroxybenzoyl-CoA reductase subunit beta
MLRLPAFELARPRSVDEAVALLERHGAKAVVVAGGTDLVPNMKHELFTPDVVVSIADVEELRGVRALDDGALAIGAMTSLAGVAAHERVRAGAPALAQAVGLVAGPQLRTMGTLGGNVLLDTRCQWYNQTYFWREALGFCLKKDGTACHVVAGGKKCVAAASNDSVPALMTLGAELVLVSPAGRRTVRVDDFWVADGIVNKELLPAEVLALVRVPRQAAGHRGAYGKLRERGSIDFPLLGVAARVDLDDQGAVVDADVVLTALQARPVRLAKVREALVGHTPGRPAFDEAVAELARRAARQCRPLANVPGDAEYRHAMVPVYVRRTLLAAAAGEGPVHHV